MKKYIMIVADTNDDYIPYWEAGIHTIKSVDILTVVEETKLL